MDTKLLGLILQGDKRIAKEITDLKNSMGEAGLTESGAIIQTAAGESIVANDTSDEGLKGLRVFGKTEQKTYSGKNLFNPANIRKGYILADSYAITEDTRTTYVFCECEPDTYYTVTKTVGARFAIACSTTNPYPGTLITYLVSDTSKESLRVLTTSDAAYLVVYVHHTAYDTISLEEMLASVQIEKGSVATEYEPYTGGMPSPNPQYPQELKSIGMSKNLLQNTATSQTINGVTFTVNNDGSVTLNGTSSATIVLTLNDSVMLNKGSYILSGCPEGGSDSTGGVYYKIDLVRGNTSVAVDSGVGSNFELKESTVMTARIVIYVNRSFTNALFKPMIRYADIEDATYEPYGKDDIEVSVYGANLGITLEQGAFGVSTGEEVTNSGWPDSTRLKTSALPNHNYYIASIESGWQVYPAVGDDTIENYSEAYWHDLPYVQPSHTYKHTRFLFRKSDNSAITPDAPIIFSLIEAEYEEPKETQSLPISTPNGLPGIPVTDASLATYTDENGQMWCADEIDFERGVYVKRVGKMLLDKPSQFKTEIESHKRVYVQNNNIYNVGPARQKCILCDSLTVDTVDRDYICFQYVNAIYCYVGCTTYAEFEDFISNNPLTVQYILATPIETPLTNAELNAYKALHTNYPVTTILNDSGAHMELTYNADTKNYIDNKFTELTNAILSMGGNV